MKQVSTLVVSIVTVVLTIGLIVAVWPSMHLFGMVILVAFSVGIIGGVIWCLVYGAVIIRGKLLAQRLLVADDHRFAFHDRGEVVVYPTLQAITALPPPVQQGQIGPIEVGLPIAPAYRTIAHLIAPGRLILGYGVSGPIYGDITDLLSTAVVGRPGTGKSTMLRFVCAQVLRVGGQPLIWDPHGSIADELGDLLQCAESASEIDHSAAWLDQELDRRLAARRRGQTDHQPLLLLADEWPVINALSDQGTQTARRVILEGRKVGIYGMISGQGLPAQLLGGTLVRDALASRYVFNTTTQQARMAGIENETAKTFLAQLDTSGPGRAILATARSRPEIIAIPKTGTDDLRGNVGKPWEPLAKPMGRIFDTPDEVPVVRRETDTLGNMGNQGEPLLEPFPAFPDIPDAERQAIMALARAGVPRGDMCKALDKNNRYYPTVKAVLDREGV